jgi:parallel beta-helix repeat protein
LRGAIPAELGSLLQLQQLDLNDNHLEEEVPSELGALVQLELLFLPRNRLTGTLPSSLANLTALTDGSGLDLRWNGVYTTDEALRAFLNTKQEGGNWEGSQTVAPGNVVAVASTGISATLNWDPIEYSTDHGRYEVYAATSSGGPYERYMSTSESFSKWIDEGEVGPLLPDVTYFLVLQTVTYPHPENPRNIVVSDFSPEVEVSIDARPAYFVSPDGDDGNDCLTPDTACATVNGAFAKAPGSAGPFYLAPGTYPEVVTIADNTVRHVIGAGVSQTTVEGRVDVWGAFAAVEDLTLRAGMQILGGFYGDADPHLFVRHVEIRGSSGTGVWTNEWGAYMVFNSVTIAENRAGFYAWVCCTSFTNCTISENWDSGFYGLKVGDATLENCTVTNNGGLGIDRAVAARLINTIVANNGSGDCDWPEVQSLGHNLDGDGSCGLDPLLGDLVAVDPLLGSLRNNGGKTRTHALLEGSPAIDAGPPGCGGLTIDQRGYPRPFDGNGDEAAVCDVGAYEYNLLIFEDGFDSGDVSAWNAFSPPAD